MPGPTCVKCQVEFDRVKSGVNLVQMFNQPQQPYKIWQADLWRCPGCGFEIVSGYGHHPYAEHYQDGFAEAMDWAKRSKIIYQYERSWLLNR